MTVINDQLKSANSWYQCRVEATITLDDTPALGSTAYYSFLLFFPLFLSIELDTRSLSRLAAVILALARSVRLFPCGRYQCNISRQTFGQFSISAAATVDTGRDRVQAPLNPYTRLGWLGPGSGHFAANKQNRKPNATQNTTWLARSHYFLPQQLIFN